MEGPPLARTVTLLLEAKEMRWVSKGVPLRSLLPPNPEDAIQDPAAAAATIRESAAPERPNTSTSKESDAAASPATASTATGKAQAPSRKPEPAATLLLVRCCCRPRRRDGGHQPQPGAEPPRDIEAATAVFPPSSHGSPFLAQHAPRAKESEREAAGQASWGGRGLEVEGIISAKRKEA